MVGKRDVSRRKDSSFTGKGTIDTNSSIRIQSPKWHDEVRAIATSAFLIPVRRFPPGRGTFHPFYLPSFLPSFFFPLPLLFFLYLSLFLFSLVSLDKSFEEKIQVRLYGQRWPVRTNPPVPNSPFRTIVRRLSVLDRNHPVYNVRRGEKYPGYAANERLICRRARRNTRGNREQAVFRGLCPSVPLFFIVRAEERIFLFFSLKR